MGKKEDRVRRGIRSHVEEVRACLEALTEATRLYLDGDDAFVEHTKRVHDLESEADSVRRDTERVLFEGAFLPGHREDYFLLLERVDEVADKAEDVANHIVLTQPPVPDELRDDIHEIVDDIDEMDRLLEKTVDTLFEDTSAVEDHVRELRSFEEAVDDREHRVVKQLFEAEGDVGEKLLVKEMVEMLARVTDMMEDVGDHVAIFVVKRRT